MPVTDIDGRKKLSLCIKDVSASTFNTAKGIEILSEQLGVGETVEPDGGEDFSLVSR